MAGVLGIYGLIVAVILNGTSEWTTSFFFSERANGLACLPFTQTARNKMSISHEARKRWHNSFFIVQRLRVSRRWVVLRLERPGRGHGHWRCWRRRRARRWPAREALRRRDLDPYFRRSPRPLRPYCRTYPIAAKCIVLMRSVTPFASITSRTYVDQAPATRVKS